ncbi:transporter [Tautonia sp. JC769]|uniref:transporter n=1 Tax=Tautonia sp. JC769 TaxID=3232135 RepID=UPI0034577644
MLSLLLAPMRRFGRVALASGLAVGLAVSPASGQESRSLGDLLLNWDEPPAAPGDEVEAREEFIETDRNSFTFAPFAPGRGRLIVESAYSYINIGDEGTKHSFPESILRYGVGDRLELRFGYNFETGPASEVAEGNIVSAFGINAEQQVYYGAKYQLTRQRPDFRLMPHSAFLAQAHTPVGSIEGRSQMRLGYVWGWRLPNGWTLDQSVRFGTDREGEDGFALWAPSTVLRIPFGREKRWFTHVEYFSVMSQDKDGDFSKQFIDTGLHYLITPNFEVGSVVAFGINDQTQGVLVNVGFGVRF